MSCCDGAFRCSMSSLYSPLPWAQVVGHHSAHLDPLGISCVNFDETPVRSFQDVGELWLKPVFVADDANSAAPPTHPSPFSSSPSSVTVSTLLLHSLLYLQHSPFIYSFLCLITLFILIFFIFILLNFSSFSLVYNFLFSFSLFSFLLHYMINICFIIIFFYIIYLIFILFSVILFISFCYISFIIWFDLHSSLTPSILHSSPLLSVGGSCLSLLPCRRSGGTMWPSWTLWASWTLIWTHVSPLTLSPPPTSWVIIPPFVSFYLSLLSFTWVCLVFDTFLNFFTAS